MIKPGTLCMIRGVPTNRPGHEFNGSVVVSGGIKTTRQDGMLVYYFEPPLFDARKNMYTGCREQWLFPFEDFDPSELDVTDKELETA